jgi:5-methyltetrahydrofolate--homocysteine methyltransferase
MGCPVIFSGTNMYSRPCIQDWQDYTWQRPTLENPWAQKLLEFLDALVKHAGGRFACGPTLMRGPADICSAMRGGTELALDLYDHPDNVRRLAALSADVWIEVGKAQLALVPESDSGYMVGCAGLRCWMPQKGIWLQDDAISLLSPRFYRELFLPQVRRIAAEFPAIAFHLHGNTLWPVDLILSIDGIDVLELNYDAGVCNLGEVIEAWKKVQRHGKPVIAFADVTIDELRHVLHELFPVGLSIQSISPTMDLGKAKRDLVYGQATA